MAPANSVLMAIDRPLEIENRNGPNRSLVGVGGGCLTRIRAARPRLTRSDRRIAQTVFDDPYSVIMASVRELAERAETSEAAISRFAQRLGYRGFPELKISLSQDLATHAQDIYEDIDVADDLETIKRKVTAANVRSLQDTLQVLETAALAAAIDALLSSGRIYFVGVGGSAVLALDAYHKFLRTGLNVAALTDTHEQLMRAATANPSDVFVVVSHTGATRDLIEVAQLARSRGATIIAISSFGRSPISRVATINLNVSTLDTLYRTEALTSRLAMLTVTDILYVGVAARTHERMLNNLLAIRKAIARSRI